MLNLARPLKPEDYLAMAWRRKWLILIPFVIVSGLAIVYTFYMPKLYRSSTLILLIPQRVPTEYIKATVTESIQERIHSISTQILSRTNLQTVINEFGLYKEEAGGNSQEEIIEKMRLNIEIQLKGGQKQQRTDAFEVFYAGPDPKTVMMVTNRLASLFVEQNLKIREQQAEGTASFLADQLKKTQADLERQEKEITAFKMKHMGELPEQMQANLSVLQQLQLQNQRISDSIRSAEDRKVLYVNQIAELRKYATPARAEEPAYSEEPAVSTGAAGKENLQESLARLKAKYTEKHPDVVALKKRIDEEQQEREAAPKSGSSLPTQRRRTRAAPAPVGQTDTMIANIQAQLAAVDSEIRQLRDEGQKTQVRIREYEQRIEITPKREEEMKSLARDYENSKKLYDSLLAKKLDSEQAKAMEQRQQGEQFRVLDAAQLPAKPWKPDILKMIALSLALGLGAGLGLALLVEYMDRSFKDPEDLAAFTGLSVLAVVPRIELEEGGKAKERKVESVTRVVRGMRVW